MNDRIKRILKNPKALFLTIGGTGLLNWISDKRYLEIAYYAKLGKKLNLDSPKTFNEKLQWLKLHDRRDIYTAMVDKYEAKKYVASVIGQDCIIPTLGVWDSVEALDFKALPDQFVLKCTHDSGGLVICKDKSRLDTRKTARKLQKSLKRNYYWRSREWPYKNVKPRIIAEKYMSELNESSLIDYKIHCFNGVPRVILVCKDRYTEQGMTEDFFTADWEHLDVRRPSHNNSKTAIEKPAQLDKMLEIATKLSRDIPFARVDLYIVGEKIYFGEITFFPASGVEVFQPDSFDEVMGDWIALPGR